MKEIADSLFLLRGFPPAGFNIYLLRSGETVVVDTSTKHSRRRILRQLPGRPRRSSSPTRIAITPARCTPSRRRPGHRSGQARAMRTRSRARRRSRCPSSTRTTSSIACATGGRSPSGLAPASRRRGGRRVHRDRVPGHTPGQIGLWRESDRTVICADMMRSMNLVTGLPQLGEMPKIFTVDISEARRSIRKLAALEANTVCFGHGRPLTKNAAEKINEFAAEPAARSRPRPSAPAARLGAMRLARLQHDDLASRCSTRRRT